MLEKKIAASIELLKEGEKLALALNPQDGYYVAFSGGKDSQVMLDLVRLSGVKFRAYYSVTGIDPPENYYFIRRHYPDVELIHPKRKYLRLLEDYGLPTINRRYCCNRIKEGLGAGNVVLTGVRAAESKKRASYASIEIYSRRKEHEGRPRERKIDELLANEHQCIKGKDRVMMRPVLNWTDEEIWQYIKDRHLPINPCYESVGRVGCMFCPFSSVQQMGMYEKLYPKFREQILRRLTKYWNKFNTHELSSPEEYYEWWKTKRSVEVWKKRHSA